MGWWRKFRKQAESDRIRRELELVLEFQSILGSGGSKGESRNDLLSDDFVEDHSQYEKAIPCLSHPRILINVGVTIVYHGRVIVRISCVILRI